MRKHFTCLLSVLVGACFFLSKPEAKSMKEDAVPGGGFDRAQTLVLNLNRVQGSSGWYLLEGLKYTSTMDHDLTKALRQVEEVDRTYAKLRGKPDNKYLETTAIKIDRAVQANHQLNEDLRDAFEELKAQIKETLVMDEVVKKH